MAQQARREEQQKHCKNAGAPSSHPVGYQTAKKDYQPSQQRITDVTRTGDIVDAERAVNPLRNNIERTAIVLQIPILLIAVQGDDILEAGGVGSVRLEIVHYEPALRNLELVLIATVSST